MRLFGYIWGVGGVLLLLVFSIYRLTPTAMDLQAIQLSILHRAALALSVCFMVYAEGYKGFHLSFSPRVVARASYLWQHPRPAHTLLAPLFCMGYFHTTKKRQRLSIGLTLMISAFVLLARQLPPPWREIVDAGVVAGLVIGICSIVSFVLRAAFDNSYRQVSPELPGDDQVGQINPGQT